jgi:hypothetical protein
MSQLFRHRNAALAAGLLDLFQLTQAISVYYNLVSTPQTLIFSIAIGT